MSNQVQESELPKQERPPLWKLLAALAVGAGLLYFAFRDCDFNKVFSYLGGINPTFVALTFVSGVTSHFIRAVRWVVLLKPVAGRDVSLWYSFYAVMIGYAVNVALPRGGEVARLVEMSRLEKLPWASVMPTMLIDRLIDLVLLAFLVGVTLTILPKSVLDSMPALVPTGIAMLVGATVGLLALPKLSLIIRTVTGFPPIKKLLPERIFNMLEEKTAEFDKGAKCLSNPIAYPIIALLSIAMWFFYWLNFMLIAFAFGLQDKVSALNLLVVFTIGSMGVLVPTPGSAGGFHVLVQRSLMMAVPSINNEQALAYATVLHIIAFVGVTCLPAAFCILVESLRKRR